MNQEVAEHCFLAFSIQTCSMFPTHLSLQGIYANLSSQT